MGQLIDALAVGVLVALLMTVQYYRYRLVSRSGFDRQGLSRAYWRLAIVLLPVGAFLLALYVLVYALNL